MNRKLSSLHRCRLIQEGEIRSYENLLKSEKEKLRHFQTATKGLNFDIDKFETIISEQQAQIHLLGQELSKAEANHKTEMEQNKIQIDKK